MRDVEVDALRDDVMMEAWLGLAFLSLDDVLVEVGYEDKLEGMAGEATA